MIIFLYGEDYFRSSRKLLEIKSKFLSTDKQGTGLSVFDCEGASSADKDIIKDIINTLNTANLLAPKRLVIVKNLIGKISESEQKNFLDFLKKKKSLIDDKDSVLVFWENNLPKKGDVFFKFIVEKSKSQNFEKLTGLKLEAWIFKAIKEISPEAKISKNALSKLVAYCGEDNFLLFNEIQKLINYCDQKMIEEKDIELLVRANLSGNIFKMVDALGTNNKREALSLLHEHLEKGDDPFYILSMFFYQFRNMLKVSDLMERGIRSEYEISKITKLHPFVVKKSLAQTRSFSFERLKNIYQNLGELDSTIKTGKIDIRLALDKFISEL